MEFRTQLPSPLAALRGFLCERMFHPLLLCTGISLLLMVGRHHLRRSDYYDFLAWNLFLAWVPYLCALALDAAAARRWGAGWTVALGATWLVFFPNALYIMTDFVHLDGDSHWYDLGLIAAFAWTGWFLGLASMLILQRAVRRAAGTVAGWAFVLATGGLGAFGVYVGRMLRWNSWHVLTRPDHIVGSLLAGLSNPLAHRRAIGFTLVFAALFLVCYLTITAAGRWAAAERDEAKGS